MQSVVHNQQDRALQLLKWVWYVEIVLVCISRHLKEELVKKITHLSRLITTVSFDCDSKDLLNVRVLLEQS